MSNLIDPYSQHRWAVTKRNKMKYLYWEINSRNHDHNQLLLEYNHMSYKLIIVIIPRYVVALDKRSENNHVHIQRWSVCSHAVLN